MPQASIVAIFVTSWLVGLSGAISPGPVLALDIRESVKRGFWAGPTIALGHSILELFVVVGLYLGLARFLSGGSAVAAVGFLGGGFLLWMAWSMLRNPGLGAPSAAYASGGNPRGGHGPGPLLAGALVSLANPFWTLWWATLGMAYLVWAQELGLVGVASFYVGHILSDFAWYSLVSLAIASGRRLMSDALYKGIMIACGLFLGGMGGFFIVRGVGFLTG